ncbi:MAG: hypothetical protein AMXMBFR36_30810 [Acidobacteriota bacterium]
MVAVGPNGWADVKEQLETSGRHTALGFHKAWWRGVRFFHRDGSLYEVESALPERELGLISKALAYTIFNPRLYIRYQYRRRGSYEIGTFAAAVAEAIEKDDDILTQFADRDVLLEEVKTATNFDTVVAAILHGTTGESAF